MSICNLIELWKKNMNDVKSTIICGADQRETTFNPENSQLFLACLLLKLKKKVQFLVIINNGRKSN